MDRTVRVSSFRVGNRVEVVTHFTGAWVGGFEIASTSAAGCSVRRVSDGTVLPALFGYDDVRLALGRSDLDRDQPRTQATLLHEGHSDASVVVRLPADLDNATVEAIREAVLDAVDAYGEVVQDLDGVLFLASASW
jgi:hypothetical protein